MLGKRQWSGQLSRISIVLLAALGLGENGGFASKDLSEQAMNTQSFTLRSPEKAVEVRLGWTASDGLSYSASFRGKPILESSLLGLDIRELPGMSAIKKISASEARTSIQSSELLWGEDARLSEHHVEQRFTVVAGEGHQELTYYLDFRLADRGLAFRYVIPKQPSLGAKEDQPGRQGRTGQGVQLTVIDELTSFRLAEDAETLWIPNDYDTYEWLYKKTPLSEIHRTRVESDHTHSNPQGEKRGVNTPVTMRRSDGIMLMLHEAQLIDYADMTLFARAEDPLHLHVDLVPWPNGDRVRAQGSLTSPWRMLMVGEDEADLLNNRMILTLNPPTAYDEKTLASLPEPINYIGIFWSLHLGVETWQKKGGRHGATTQKAKATIDFARRHGIGGVLIEGWNTGWESWYAEDNFDFTTPYSDFDLLEVARYAREQGVELIGHHESGGQVESYEARLDQAFGLYQSLGIKYVKTGYAGKIRPQNQFHHGQWMVRHYQHVVEKAAEYGIAVIVHEPIKPTGLRRSYPNLFSAEGMRGMEWNAWSKGNPPRHHIDLAFTRNVVGPMDYTPGVVDLTFENSQSKRTLWNSLGGLEESGRVHTTLAKQLAMYAVFYSPVQMIVDLKENLEGHPALDWMKRVPTGWEESRVLDARFGDYVVTARKVAGKPEWYVGGMTGDNAHVVTLDLAALPKGTSAQDSGKGSPKGSTTGSPEGPANKVAGIEDAEQWEVQVFQDAPDTDYRSSPGRFTTRTLRVANPFKSNLQRPGQAGVIEIPMAESGGFLLHVRPVQD